MSVDEQFSSLQENEVNSFLHYIFDTSGLLFDKSKPLRVYVPDKTSKAKDYKAFINELDAIVVEYIRSLQVAEGVINKDLYQQRFYSVVGDAFIKAVKTCKEQYVDAILERNVRQQPILADQVLQSVQKVAGEECRQVRQLIQDALAQRGISSKDTPTPYVSMPSPPSEHSSAFATSSVNFSVTPLMTSDPLLVLSSPSDVVQLFEKRATIGNGLQYGICSIFGKMGSIFTTRHFAKGDLITTFDGKVISFTKGQQLHDEGYHKQLRVLKAGKFVLRSSGFIREGQGSAPGHVVQDNVLICESLAAGHIIKCTKSEVNSQFYIVTDEKNAQVSANKFKPKRAFIGLFATKDIAPNTELFR